MVGLDPSLYRKRYPSQLSGGEAQRIGVARAIAARPRALLMDEPFGAVDAVVRATLQRELVRIVRELKTTTIFVTHDVDEAFRLADRVVVMRAGRVEQVARPKDSSITRPRITCATSCMPATKSTGATILHARELLRQSSS